MGVFLALIDLDFTPTAPPPSCRLGWSLALRHVWEFAHAIKALAPLALVLASSKIVSMLLTLHPLNIDPPYQDFCWTFNLILTLNFLWTLLSWHFYACFIYWLIFLFAWFLSIFKKHLTLRIEWMPSFSSSSYFLMWPLAASLGLWLQFLGLISVWL